jgi:hypothetical protein
MPYLLDLGEECVTPGNVVIEAADRDAGLS